MYITPMASQNFRGLIPLSEYKGPILKLTKKRKRTNCTLYS